MSEALKNYYKVCAIKSVDDHDKPLIDYLSERMVKVLFSKHQTELYMKEEDGRLQIKESVVGAGENGVDKSGAIIDMEAYVAGLFKNKKPEN